MDDHVTIRLSVPEDAAQLARLRWMAAEEESPLRQEQETFTAHFQAFVPTALSQGWTVFVAEVDGNLVANIWLYEVPMLPRPDTHHDRGFGYVANAFTIRSFRNQGIGAALLEAVVELGRQQDWEQLIVWPTEESIPFYRRAGFQEGEEEMELYF